MHRNSWIESVRAHFPWNEGPIVNYVLRGGGGGFGGGYSFKTSPFWGIDFSLVRNTREIKFCETATVVWGIWRRWSILDPVGREKEIIKYLTRFQVPREGLFDRRLFNSSPARQFVLDLYAVFEKDKQTNKGSNVTLDVHWRVTVFYQQIENGNIANQIHGFTIDYGKFILITSRGRAKALQCSLSFTTFLFHFSRNL